MRPSRVVLAVFVVIFAATSLPAQGIDTLHSASSVRLRRGSSAQTPAAAVTALDVDDNVIYDVTAKRRRGVSTVIYDMKIEEFPSKPDLLSIQLKGSTVALTCGLKLAFFRWRDERFKTVFTSSVGTLEDFFTSPQVNARPFVRHKRARARVTCRSKEKFERLLSERIRVVATTN
jgi:hypothetical protein